MELVKILLLEMAVFVVCWFLLAKKTDLGNKIHIKIESLDNRVIMLAMFIFIVAFEGRYALCRKLPFVADEVYTLSGATFFAGHDWSNYMSLHKFYNYGYTMLLSPIYRLFTDPVMIYRCMLFVNVIVHALTAVVAYYVVNRQLKCNKTESALIALVSTCNAIVMFFRGFVYNELPMTLIVWLIVLLMLKLINETGSRRVIWSVVLAFITAYAYSIHSRCLVLFVTVAIVCLIYLILYKKWLVQPAAFLAVFITAIQLQKSLLSYVQTHLYQVELGKKMVNTTEQVVTSTSRYEVLTSLDGIKKIICNFFSVAGATSIETGGILTIVTVVVLYYAVKNYKQITKEKKEYVILFLFSTIILWGMAACVALLGAGNGRYRFLLYTRYVCPFIGPFLLCGLWTIQQQTNLSFKGIVIGSGVITAIVGAVYVFYSLPILKGESMTSNASLYFFKMFTLYPKQQKFSKNVLGVALLLLLGYTCLLLVMQYKKHVVAICITVLIFSGALYTQLEKKQCIPASNRRYETADATYELLENDWGQDQGSIYCAGTENYRKAVLVMLYDKRIQYDCNQLETQDNTVVLTNRITDLENYRAPYVVQLDNSEWVGIWNEEMYNACRQYEMAD